MRVMKMWGLLLLLCILGCTAVCDPAKVRQMELELSRFTDPLFDVRQTDAVLPARSVLEHIRRIVRTPVEQLDQNFLLLCDAAGLDLEECNTCKYFFGDTFRDELIQSTQYLFRLQQLRALPIVPDKRVLIVGSGPAGLIAGVHATVFGLNTTVVDSRRTRTRNIWFDLATEAENAPSRELLAELGGRFTNMRVQEHAGTNMISVRCQELERFLAKTVLFLGGEVITGATVTSVRGGNSATSWFVEATEGPSSRQIGFDLLVLAEGHKGQVMEHLGIDSVRQQVLELPFPYNWLQPETEWQEQSAFQHLLQQIQTVEAWLKDRTPAPQQGFDRKLLHVDGLHQTTLIAKLAPLPNGECPRLRKNGTEVLDPFVPGAVIKGVTSVFKRFFYSYCELQVLLDHDSGSQVFDEYNSTDGDISRLPTDSKLWTTLIHTWRLLLDDGSTEIRPSDLATPSAARQWLAKHLSGGDQMAAAKTTLMKQLRETSGGSLDGRVLQLKVEMAPATVGVLSPKQPQFSAVPVDPEASARAGKRAAVIVLGDASVTSHYRLGVGVNHAVRTGNDLRSVLHVMRGQAVAVTADGEVVSSSPRAFYNALVNFHGRSLYRNYALVQYQLFAMYFEAYCGAVAYDNRLYRLLPNSFEFVEVSISDLKCVQPLQPVFAQSQR